MTRMVIPSARQTRALTCPSEKSGLRRSGAARLRRQTCALVACLTPDPHRAAPSGEAYVFLGVILGGRLGYVLFYKPAYYFQNLAEILYVWQGGMSFHGGLLGLVVAIVIFSRRRGFRMLALGDLVAAAVPIGLFFGRIANFINGELFGRTTDVPWRSYFRTAAICRGIRVSSTRPSSKASSPRSRIVPE